MSSLISKTPRRSAISASATRRPRSLSSRMTPKLPSFGGLGRSANATMPEDSNLPGPAAAYNEPTWLADSLQRIVGKLTASILRTAKSQSRDFFLIVAGRTRSSARRHDISPDNSVALVRINPSLPTIVPSTRGLPSTSTSTTAEVRPPVT